MSAPKSKIAQTRRDITKALDLAKKVEAGTATNADKSDLVTILDQLDGRHSKKEKAFRTTRTTKPNPVKSGG